MRKMDPPVIEHLYEAHGPALLGYLRRSFGRSASAEDLLQETFVQALRQPGRLAEAQSQRAWLFGIARHLGLTALRRHQTVRPLKLQEESAVLPDPRLEQMREAIGDLPVVLRESLQLRLNEQLSYEEIAQMLEIPVGTVRSRLHTAMRRLREVFEVSPSKELP